MDTTRLNNWLTLAANLGVIAGILFLAFEIRQSNRIALVANEMDIRQSYADVNQSLFTNRESSELLVRATRSDAEFDAVESGMLYSHVLMMLNLWISVEIGYNNGMLPRKTFDDMEDDIRSYAKYYPALHSVFQGLLNDYPSGRESEVYRIINDALSEMSR
jgi:hypothetical protein